ncbi:MAG: glucan 1,4-beta-glucosidase, partial [Rhizorhabdus sp.]|nr:glucan 1,4-beta-glucosidase [Rhizorhabdus sp.]
GYGLSYARPAHLGLLDERRPKGIISGTPAIFWGKGRLPDGWSFRTAPLLTVKPIDRLKQEDSRRFSWTGPAEVRIEAGRALDYARETNGEISLVVDYRVDSVGKGPVTIGMGTGGHQQAMTVTRTIAASRPGTWSTLAIPLGCFRRDGLDMSKVTTPFILSGGAGLSLSISDIRIDYRPVPMTVCGDK